MKASALAVLLPAALAFGAGAQDLLTPTPAAGPGATTARAPATIMIDPAISQAVRATLAESKPAPLANDDGHVLHGEAYGKFARQVDEAAVPSCWRPDALKHNPPRLGPINLGGVLALPFWGWSIVSGKCNK
jgi:hypothetical protein